MSIRPTGRLEQRDGTSYVVLERSFRAPAEDVWAAVTEPGRLERWIGTYAGDPATGEVAFRMTAEGDDVPEERMEIRTCTPPHHLALTSHSGEGTWLLELRLREHAGETVLEFAQASMDAKEAESVGPGWEYYLEPARRRRDRRRRVGGRLRVGLLPGDVLALPGAFRGRVSLPSANGLYVEAAHAGTSVERVAAAWPRHTERIRQNVPSARRRDVRVLPGSGLALAREEDQWLDVPGRQLVAPAQVDARVVHRAMDEEPAVGGEGQPLACGEHVEDAAEGRRNGGAVAGLPVEDDDVCRCSSPQLSGPSWWTQATYRPFGDHVGNELPQDPAPSVVNRIGLPPRLGTVQMSPPCPRGTRT